MRAKDDPGKLGESTPESPRSSCGVVYSSDCTRSFISSSSTFPRLLSISAWTFSAAIHWSEYIGALSAFEVPLIPHLFLGTTC